MNYRIISYILGWVLNIEGACMLLPLMCAIEFDEPNKWIFALSAVLCTVIGIPLTVKKPRNRSMFAKEGYVIVALTWIVISIFGAVPFMLSGTTSNFADALFETVSGFTTTGASILTDVEAVPKSVIFWRSFTHWIGGMGVIVFLMAFVPMSGGDKFYMIKAESPGHTVSKLVPTVKSSAKLLYSIYLGLTVLQIILLLCGGLDWFEATTLTFGSAGTGGFAVRNSGIADYSSYVQIVITIFMAVFGVDFSFYYLILMKKFKSAFKMEEVIAYVSIILAAIGIITLNISGMYSGVPEALKHSAFQVSSIITTTGYATTDFNQWPQLSQTILVLLMFCGACAGSTGGGIKVSRIVILFKSIIKEIRMIIHPKSTIKVKFNGKPLEHDTLRAINVFFAAYMMIFAAVLLIVSFDNFDFTSNFTAVLSTSSNIGPGLSMVGPMGNFSAYSPLSKLALVFAMLAGRLEIFPMLVLFSKNTWKK